MDNIFLVNSASFEVLIITQSLTVMQGATVDLSPAAFVSGTFRGSAEGLTEVSASYIISTATASYTDTASYIKPGASLFLVSGSGGAPTAFIEPYDYSVGVYIPPFKEGRMWYDTQYHNMDYYTDDSGFRAQLCKELIIGVHNPYATTLSRLSVVYVSGSTGERPDVYLAQADGTGAKSKIIGVIRSDIASGSNGYMLTRGVMHRSNMTGYQIGTSLWLSPTVAGGLTPTRPGQPNEEVLVGYCSEGGSQGSFVCAIQDYPVPANAYAGMTSYPAFTDDTSSFQVYISSGSVNLYNNADGIGAITQYPVPAITMSIPASLSASFVYATTNGISASYDLTSDYSSINGTTKVLVSTLYRADVDTHWMQTDREGLALANKLNNRLIATERFVRESGFTLYTTGSNQFVITEGAVWYGASKLTQQEFDSRNTGSVNPNYETHWAYHSASAFTIPIQPDGKYINTYYDNGTNLVPLAPNSWSVNYFYRILGENPFDEDVFVLPSNYQYSNEIDADVDSVPNEIPSVLNDVSIMVGRIIFQSGSVTGSVQSAFTSDFGTSTVSQHNSLAGLQGGSGGEYYHMTAAEYNGLGITASYAPTSSYSITSSYALSGDISVNPVGDSSTYSFALLRNTSSVEQIYGDSAFDITYNPSTNVLSIPKISATSITASILGYQTTLGTGSSYPITASQANIATSASYAISASWAPTGESGTSLTTGSLYPITSSWAVTASYSMNAGESGTSLNTGSTYPITASWAISASWAPAGESGTSLTTGSTYPITSSWSINATNALTAAVATGYQLALGTGSTYPFTSSWAVNATNALTTSLATGYQLALGTGSTYPITASWAVNATNALTAAVATGYQLALGTGSTYPFTSSWATNAGSSSISNTALTANTASYVLGSSVSGTVTSASYSITSSFVISQNVFTRGGVFSDYGGLAGEAALNLTMPAWIVPYSCSAVTLRATRIDTGGLTGVATVNARKNFATLLLTASAAAKSGSWATYVVPTSPGAFIVGDSLEFLLVSSSNYPTVVTVQLDFTR